MLAKRCKGTARCAVPGSQCDAFHDAIRSDRADTTRYPETAMDRKTLVAVGLCVLFLIFFRPLLHFVGWDKYLPTNEPVATAPRDTTHSTTSANPVAAAPTSAGTLSKL